MEALSQQVLKQVADYFQALSDCTRLRILNLLREGEQNVGDLARACGCTSANVSRHLAMLVKLGLVSREGRGTSVYYQIADPSVFRLCEVVCDNLARNVGQAPRPRRGALAE